jgi:signal transduction histidine kinase
MGRHTADETGEAMARFLDQEGGAIVARWTQLLQAAMPQVFLAMKPAIWSARVRDTFSVLKRELRQPDGLRYPVFGRRSGSTRVRDLGLRGVSAHLEGDLDQHEVESAYFLLAQAIAESAGARDKGPLREALPLVDHFFKQLTVAMAMAVTDRRTAILEEQLREQARQLQAVRRESEGVLAFVGHEVRDSATAILGDHAALRAHLDGLSGEAGPALDRAEAQVRRVLRFAEGIAEHVELDAGTRPLRVAPFDLALLLDEAIAATKPLWAPRRLAVRRAWAPELPAVPGDRARLAEVARVLLAHAIGSMPEGGTLTLRAYAEASQVIWEISGAGLGDLGEQQAVLTRLDHPPDAPDGPDGPAPLGLGLPTARLIVELHGGTLTAVPDRHGAGLRVSLPRLPRAGRMAMGEEA